MTRFKEVEIKQQRLRSLMEEKGLSGVLLKKQPNFSWFSAGGLNMVNIATEIGMSSLLITPQRRYVIANRIESSRMMIEEGLKELGFELIEHEWDQDLEANLVKEVVGDVTRVGADLSFPGFVNLDSDIKKLRYQLTENEIERYLFLGVKLSTAMEKVALGIRPGDLECEIAGRIGAELWKDRIDPTGIMVAADERVSLYRHPIPTQKMVKRYVMICCNARFKGLITTITRTLHFGRPDPILVNQFQQNCEIECRMIEATKPGMPFTQAFRTALEAYREFGYGEEWRLHHQGGAMGYYGRDIKVTERTQELVLENQAVCWNPSISGTKTEDGFIATKQGPLFITKPIIFPTLKFQVKATAFERPGILQVD